ncbi:hypothetical protein AX16_004693 [Volvariella volvacea WC 439]|nr:hypothetical protein AX16_004693 [Volvariella volvacea WC 439]
MTSMNLVAKPAIEWTEHELNVLGIKIGEVDENEFFNSIQLPEPAVSPVLLNYETQPQGSLSTEERLFYFYLQDAMTGDKSSINDFATFLLQLLKYEESGRFIRHNNELSFNMSGKSVDAAPDICVLSEGHEVYLVQHIIASNDPQPEPTLIADAIAAFNRNNVLRKRTGQPELKSQIIPGILMSGTAPTFYLIPVSEELLKCIDAGRGVSQPVTTVKKLIPRVPGPSSFLDEGLFSPENRRPILQYYEALKVFMGNPML